MHHGAQPAADVFGADPLFQGAPKLDPERQVSVLNTGSFHQVECMVDRIGDLWTMIIERTQSVLIFGCAILFIGI
jgi:hypothetical protein